MSHFPSVPIPLELDDVQRIQVSAGEICLRLSGTWRAAEDPGQADRALLVIQIDGRRHRFTPEPETKHPAPGRWSASFMLPEWAEPRHDGQAALWIGEAVIPIAQFGVARRQPGSGPPALGSAVPADAPDQAGAPPLPAQAPVAAPDWSRALPSSPETPRSGPLADMLLRETITALHSELEVRATEAARLRGALAGAQSELEARTESHGELQGTLGELGAELRRLMEAVAAQREELTAARAELAAAREEHAAAIGAVREEHAAVLSAVREEHAAAIGAVRDEHAAVLSSLREERAVELRDLQARLQAAEAAAQGHAAHTTSLREQLATAQVAREAADSETAGLRAELERLGAELAVTRERVQSESGDLGQANRLLADARALAEQLRSGAAAG